MIASPLLRKSASIAYTGVRLPLAAVEQRLPERSRIRTGLQVALHTIDSSVAPLLYPRADDSGAPAEPSRPASTFDAEAEREAIADAVREQQPDVGELADPDLDVAEVQARLQAKHAVEAREETR